MSNFKPGQKILVKSKARGPGEKNEYIAVLVCKIDENTALLNNGDWVDSQERNNIFYPQNEFFDTYPLREKGLYALRHLGVRYSNESPFKDPEIITLELGDIFSFAVRGVIYRIHYAEISQEPVFIVDFKENGIVRKVVLKKGDCLVSETELLIQFAEADYKNKVGVLWVY